MTEEASQFGVKELNLNGVEVIRVGRLLKLSEGSIGATYLVDVTDSDDMTTIDPAFPEEGPEKVSDLMKKELESPDYLDRLGTSNGVVVLVSDKLGKNPGEKRVYLGVTMTREDDPEQIDLTTQILAEAGFERTRKDMYVPMAFDGYEMAAEIIKTEIMKAAVEVPGAGDLLGDTRADLARLPGGEN